MEGTIRDVQATPIAGAKVKSVGSSAEVVSDAKGFYFIPVHADDMLIFSKPGYTSQKIQVKDQCKINVQLMKGE